MHIAQFLRRIALTSTYDIELIMINVILTNVVFQNMISIFKGLYQDWFGFPQYNISILGIDCTGKTSLTNRIKYIHKQNDNDRIGYKPTVGLNIQLQNIKLSWVYYTFGIWEEEKDQGQYGKDTTRNLMELSSLLMKEFNKVIIHYIYLYLVNVIFHPDMAYIPLLIIVSTQEIKNQVSNLLKNAQQNQAYNRKILIEIKLQNKNQIKKALNWIYKEIYQLSQSLKK